ANRMSVRSRKISNEGLARALLGSINIGDHHKLFEPIHGTAPDIAGKNIANPTGMIIAATYMLDQIGDQKGEKIRQTINKVLESRSNITQDIGGKATTQEYTQTIINHLKN
ncbi:MAG: isocitrate/isopropylmalate family dehydrogenase, partial [Candidatus Bathyarchaeia archaeon]